MLNVVFLVLAAVLVVRAVRVAGVVPMLRMMDEPPGGSTELDATLIAGGEQSDGYVCPMHPEVRSSSPGRCPKCGMHLEPVTRQS